MKELKKAYFNIGGNGGYAIRVPIPKEMADAIRLTEDDPTVEITLMDNKIVIEKGVENMFYRSVIETVEEFEKYIKENQPIQIDYHFGGYFFARPQRSVKKGQAAPPAARINLEESEIYDKIIEFDLWMTDEIAEGLEMYKESK